MYINRKFYSLLLTLMLAGCGGSNSSNEQTTPVTQDSVEIIGPTAAEEGSRASFELKNLTGEYEVKLSAGYVLQSSGDVLEFVVPTVLNGEVQTITVEVFADDELLAEHTLTIEPLEVAAFTELPRAYPLESSRIGKYDNVPRDAEGVPLIERDGELYYYHVDLSKIAQVYYAYVRKHDRPAQETADFLAMATWLKENCIYTEWGFCSWQAKFDISAYSLPNDWTSAMAQGQAITVLLYAYAVTQDESYIEVLADAVAAFNYPVAEKGVVADFEGYRFYEEYGSEDKPAHVLNGFLFAMAGLYEVAHLAKSEAAQQAYEQGLESLRNTLHLYDLGFTSRYDYSHLNQIASTKGGVNGDLYHEIHLAQLAWLHSVSEDDVVMEYLKRFLMYDTGGLTSFGELTAASTKIIDVNVSSSISPENYGPNYLTDSNWTWRRYWSSDDVPATIALTLNNGSPEGNAIVLQGLRLTALGEKSLPAELNVYDCAGEQRKLLKSDVTATPLLAEYAYELNGYKSFTAVYDLEGVALECQTIELEMLPHQELGYIALREINVHLEQPYIIEKLLERYQAHAP